MRILNESQLERAMEAMKEYLSAPPGEDGITPSQKSHQGDQNRVKVIKYDLRPLLSGYLQGDIALNDFKIKIDSINKRKAHWGFKGIKGQMFFNMIINVADDLDECDQELKSAIAVPSNEQIASSRIKTFKSYITRIGEQWFEAGNTRHGCPKLGSIPFFLSYFWQIADRKKWPVYYTNSVNMMSDLNLWQPSGDIADDYLSFKKIHEELSEHFTQKTGTAFDLYEVEHVFWYKGENPYLSVKVEPKIDPSSTLTKKTDTFEPYQPLNRLPESYVPPIIAILPKIAKNDEQLNDAAQKSGTTLDRAFEKYIDAAFTILGFETKMLGQGKGRVPDGIATAIDYNYTIIWDAKVRANGYSMGTDDRTIREYITTQSRDMKRKRSLRNIYYLIVSSSFTDDYDDSIRSIKMDTDVNEVCLVKSDAIVAMIDAKLRDPLNITLGPDGLQRFFSNSGVLKADMVLEQLI